MKYDGLQSNGGTTGPFGGGAQLIAPANSKRQIITVTSKLIGSSIGIYAGKPDFILDVADSLEPSKFIQLDNISGQSSGSYSYDDYGSLIHQEIWASSAFGGNLNWSDISIFCPFLSWAEPEIAYRPLIYRMWKVCMGAAQTKAKFVFGANQSRILIAHSENAQGRFSTTESSPASTWVIPPSSRSSFYRYDGYGSLLQQPLFWDEGFFPSNSHSNYISEVLLA